MLMNIVEFAQQDDQKAAIIKKVAGCLEELQLANADVLVATYIEAEKTKGGIILTQNRLNESRWQCKAGLVLKIGPTAFKYDGSYPWEGPTPNLHDWVFFRASESWEFGLCPPNSNRTDHVSCRLVRSEDIKGIVARPDLIY